MTIDLDEAPDKISSLDSDWEMMEFDCVFFIDFRQEIVNSDDWAGWGYTFDFQEVYKIDAVSFIDSV